MVPAWYPLSESLASRVLRYGRSDLEKAILAHGGMAAVAKALGWPVKARQRRPNGYWDQVENVRQEVDAFINENGLQPGAKWMQSIIKRSVSGSLTTMLLRSQTLLLQIAASNKELKLYKDLLRLRWSGKVRSRSSLACIAEVSCLTVSGVMPLQKDFVVAGRYDLKRVVERWGGSAELAAVAGYQARCAVKPLCHCTVDDAQSCIPLMSFRRVQLSLTSQGTCCSGRIPHNLAGADAWPGRRGVAAARV